MTFDEIITAASDQIKAAQDMDSRSYARDGHERAAHLWIQLAEALNHRPPEKRPTVYRGPSVPDSDG